MLLEMTRGGNTAVQSNLVNYILNLDRDNKLAAHIRGRLEHTLSCVKDRKERCEMMFTPISPLLRQDFKNGMQTFNMLQQVTITVVAPSHFICPNFKTLYTSQSLALSPPSPIVV